jgi:putative transcriptional regulator
MSAADPSRSSLTGQLLVAMPGMPDPRFAHAVIFLVSHSAEGAMGLVVNQVAERLSFTGIAEQLGIELDRHACARRVHVGGPVETGRGFVLHTPDVVRDATLVIDQRFALTATIDMLKAIATGQGPERAVFALGYAGWAPGQLDEEIQRNGWLVVPGDPEIVYRAPDEQKWEQALRRLGIDPGLLSSAAGNA